MSLTQRLKNIEQRLTILEQGQKTLSHNQATLVDAFEAGTDEADDQPQLDLDGHSAGAERDQSQPL